MRKQVLFFLFIFISCRMLFAQIWTDLTISNLQIVPLNSVSTLSHNMCWAGGLAGTVVFTSNGGATWSTTLGIGIPGAPDIYVMAAVDSNNAFVGAYSTVQATAYIYQTTNRGNSWQQRFIQPGGFINDIKIVSPNLFYAYGNPVGNRWTLLKSTNGGLFWDSTNMRVAGLSNNQGDWNGMAFYNTGFGPVSLWFATNLGGVYYSSNGGTTWTFQTTPGNARTYSISFMDANTGLCSGDNNIYMTTNSGSVWNIVAVPGTGTCYTIANNSGKFWYARGNTIYYSVSLPTFVNQHVYPGPNGYRHLSFNTSAAANNESVIGGWGLTGDHVISNYTDNGIGIRQISTAIPKAYSLGQNYPNPFNPSTKIWFAVPDAGNGRDRTMQLVIYDLLGREVAVLVNQKLSPGVYEADWDASNEPSGIYFYTLKTDSYSSTKKMTLIK